MTEDWLKACVLVGVCALVVLGMWLEPVIARGQYGNSSPETRAWFEGLRSGKGPCCSDADGTVVADADWQSKDGHYQVRIDDQWIDVPPEALITEPNLIGRTMVWPIRGYLGISIRCFMPGSMG